MHTTLIAFSSGVVLGGAGMWAVYRFHIVATWKAELHKAEARIIKLETRLHGTRK